MKHVQFLFLAVIIPSTAFCAGIGAPISVTFSQEGVYGKISMAQEYGGGATDVSCVGCGIGIHDDSIIGAKRVITFSYSGTGFPEGAMLITTFANHPLVLEEGDNMSNIDSNVREGWKDVGDAAQSDVAAPVEAY